MDGREQEKETEESGRVSLQNRVDSRIVFPRLLPEAKV
jgi:hypothetical protein